MESVGNNLDGMQESSTKNNENKEVITALASVYGTVLVTLYVALSFTEVVTFPNHIHLLELNGFFLFLFVPAALFLLYVLLLTINERRSDSNTRILANHKSHGSLAIRVGAFLFGVNTLAYLSLETVDHFEMETGSPCSFLIRGFNVAAMWIFVFLQTALVVMFPRLNLNNNALIDRLGTMHVLASNVVMWMRTLIKESLHEMTESVRLGHHVGLSVNENDTSYHMLSNHIEEAERLEEFCRDYHNDIIGNALYVTSPILFPFVIEYALIGASVAFLMFRHVGVKPHAGETRVKLPDPRDFISSHDCSSSLKGLIAGLVIVALAILNLIVFFGLDGHLHTEAKAELFSNLMNCLTNGVAIVAVICGLVQTRKLSRRPLKHNNYRASQSDLDATLLSFASFFAFAYLIFTVTAGILSPHMGNRRRDLHIVNGLVEIVQIALQLIFIHHLYNKTTKSKSKPGRQVLVFLCVLNISQWLVFTFEMQKARASLAEWNFFGYLPWILIQRLTLPLTVFFRFHSAVVCVDLWKAVYNG